MLALTLIQPWAWAICHAGKRIENRDWPPPARIIGQRIAIHAGKKRDDAALILSQGIRPPGELPSMAVVATARVTGVVEKSDDRWFVGDYGWLLDEVRVLEVPVQCKGALGLWRLPPDAEALVDQPAPSDHVCINPDGGGDEGEAGE